MIVANNAKHVRNIFSINYYVDIIGHHVGSLKIRIMGNNLYWKCQEEIGAPYMDECCMVQPFWSEILKFLLELDAANIPTSISVYWGKAPKYPV